MEERVSQIATRPELLLNQDTSPAALALRPLAAGYLGSSGRVNSLLPRSPIVP